jgi:NADPH:quinone reductase
MRADLWADVEAGRLSLPIDRTFTLAEAAAAIAYMAANAHFGKIVMTA